MSAQLRQLLALRRDRHRQAQTRMSAAASALAEARDALTRLRADSRWLDGDVAATIQRLYQDSVGARLNLGGLELLAARVEGQYRRQADMRARIKAMEKQVAERESLAEDARADLTLASRNVEKLDQMVGVLAAEADARAEANAEDEAERPFLPAIPPATTETHP